MKANEFVKNCGIDSAKSLLKMGSGYCDIMGYEFHTDDLKRLVESHELVERNGGVKSVQAMFEDMHLMDLSDWDDDLDKLAKAIADVESCL